MKWQLICTSSLVICALMAGAAIGGDPDPDNCTAITAATEQVSVFVVPDGSGDSLDHVRAEATLPDEHMDATITVTLYDGHMDPVPDYPAEDLWLVSEFGGLIACDGGTIADGSTDPFGQTTFSGPLRGSGFSDKDGGEQTLVMVGGQALTDWPLDILYNSPDLNGDGLVNCEDTVLFELYWSPGDDDYRVDFFFDGNHDMTDLVLFAASEWASCSFTPTPANITVTTAAASQVSLLISPAGNGPPLTEARAITTPPGSYVDATITVTLLDVDELPVVGFPAEDLWLGTTQGGMSTCAVPSIADGPTDPSGQATFSGPVTGGGYSDMLGGEKTLVYMLGCPIADYELDILFNSPDLNGDGAVDCLDEDIFEEYYNPSEYDYRVDFYYDGTHDMSDIATFRAYHGDTCPGQVSYTTSQLVTRATAPVSVYTEPYGSGDELSSCRLYGGGTMDATLIVTLLDSNSDPIIDHPAEDIWLQIDGVVFCDGSGIARHPTDEDGKTSFPDSFNGGGYSSDQPAPAYRSLLEVYVGDCLLEPPLEIYFNSADINGDLVVDVDDAAIFMGDRFPNYHYRSDFDWDGDVDKDDQHMISEAMNASCTTPGVAVEDVPGLILYPNVPNPFNPRTTIAFQLDRLAEVELSVFDVSGRLVKTILSARELDVGRYKFDWSGDDEEGRDVASGVYLYKLRVDDGTVSRRMVLLR